MTIMITEPRIMNAISTALDMYIEMEWDSMTESRDQFNEILTMIETLASINAPQACEYYKKLHDELRAGGLSDMLFPQQ